jgi:hypothetical protein
MKVGMLFGFYPMHAAKIRSFISTLLEARGICIEESDADEDMLSMLCIIIVASHEEVASGCCIS